MRAARRPKSEFLMRPLSLFNPSRECALRSAGLYWPVPFTFRVCTPGLAASFTVIALGRAPIALGVNVTVKVHLACATSVAVQGVVPPGAAAYSPLPVTAGLTLVARLLVIVMVCAALAVPTAWAAKVRLGGAKVSGRAAVPFTSRTCCPTVALSLTTIAPCMPPLAPKAGEKVTLSVQLVPAFRTRLTEQGFVPLPTAEKAPLEAMAPRVSELALVFLTVT